MITSILKIKKALCADKKYLNNFVFNWERKEVFTFLMDMLYLRSAAYICFKKCIIFRFKANSCKPRHNSPISPNVSLLFREKANFSIFPLIQETFSPTVSRKRSHLSNSHLSRFDCTVTYYMH